MVGARPRLEPEPAAREPQAQRQVDVFLVQEERLGEAARVLEALGGNSQAGAGDEAGLGAGRATGGDALSRPAGPRDAGEMHDAAAAVDHPAPLRGHEPLPGGPAAPLGERQLDRLPKARLDDGIGVQEQEELAG